MRRCECCGQITPSASWDYTDFLAALKVFYREWLKAWGRANGQVLDEAHAEKETHDARAWEEIISPEHVDTPPAHRAIASSRPQVAWLCHLPPDDRAWWRKHGLDWLVRNHPEVTEEEWRILLPT